ncbi:hypothetical protein GCM10022267_23130 [Lentzea roselyniae]|uniref:Tetratricopeptide repeat-containing protein n=1 Tax=Lentzea roselyniae TaxID=531940 RepID=A0ABP7AM96_9PSEU
MEESDRLTHFLRDADDGLAVLSEHGLITLAGRRVHLDPGAVVAGRAMVSPELARSVDEELAAHWTASLDVARDKGQADLIVTAAIGAAPYLHRLGRWDDLARMCGTALAHDRERGLALSREVLAEAVATENFLVASWAARDVSEALRADGRLDDARELARQASEHTERAGLGPWSRAAARVRELRIRSDQGDDRAVLDEVRQLLAALPETSGEEENTTYTHARGMVLELGMNAAAGIGDQTTSLDFTEQILAGMLAANAPEADLARARYVLGGRLVALGRDDEAREPLEWCRAFCAEHGDIGLLVQVIAVLMEIEDRAGNHARAIELTADALRLAYLMGDPHLISLRHHDFAVLLGRVETASPKVLAHYLASIFVAIRTDAPNVATEIEMLAWYAFAHGLPPRMELSEYIALAEQTEGVRLGELLSALPQRLPDELQVADRAMTRAGQIMQDWSPFLTAVVLRAVGDDRPGVDENLEIGFTGLEQSAGTGPLVTALRRVLAGERGPELLDGLGLLPYGLVSKALDAISEQERAGS